jgi:hypothetical protein
LLFAPHTLGRSAQATKNSDCLGSSTQELIMTEHANPHSMPTVPAGGFEPLNPLEPGYSDPGAAEFTQPVAPTAQLFFSLFHAARIFGKSPRTIRWWADMGHIRTIKIGHARFITEAEIQRLLRGEEG